VIVSQDMAMSRWGRHPHSVYSGRIPRTVFPKVMPSSDLFGLADPTPEALVTGGGIAFASFHVLDTLTKRDHNVAQTTRTTIAAQPSRRSWQDYVIEARPPSQ
jgi:hypothetical protein